MTGRWLLAIAFLLASSAQADDSAHPHKRITTMHDVLDYRRLTRVADIFGYQPPMERPARVIKPRTAEPTVTIIDGVETRADK